MTVIVRVTAVALATLALAAYGCSSTAKPTSSGTGSVGVPAAETIAAAETAASAPHKTVYPVTVTDCDGRATTYVAAPRRVVTIDPSVTEMLLSLGLKDSIVGYTEFFPPARRWAVTRADMQSLRMINDGANYPSKEAVVAARPDLVTSVYSYAFSDPLPDRAAWDDLGIHTYQAFGSCPPTGRLPTDFSLLYRDLRNLGVIFDVQDRATSLIADIEARVTALQGKARAYGGTALRIAPYDGYDRQPTYYGGSEAAIISLAGASYVWSSLDPATSQTSWEAFVREDPQVIWIVPDAGVPVTQLEQRLESDPRFQGVTAIKNRAYVVVPQSDATIESPRLVDGLAALVDGLAALRTAR